MSSSTVFQLEDESNYVSMCGKTEMIKIVSDKYLNLKEVHPVVANQICSLVGAFYHSLKHLEVQPGKVNTSIEIWPNDKFVELIIELPYETSIFSEIIDEIFFSVERRMFSSRQYMVTSIYFANQKFTTFTPENKKKYQNCICILLTTNTATYSSNSANYQTQKLSFTKEFKKIKVSMATDLLATFKKTDHHAVFESLFYDNLISPDIKHFIGALFITLQNKHKEIKMDFGEEENQWKFNFLIPGINILPSQTLDIIHRVSDEFSSFIFKAKDCGWLINIFINKGRPDKSLKRSASSSQKDVVNEPPEKKNK